MMTNDFTIRSVRHGDELLVQEILDGMSPESRFHRFLQAVPVLSPQLRRVLADVDGVRHRAWAAYVGDRPVGVVRLIADRDGEHELSVAVVDAMHRRGVGSALIATAIEAAAEAGIESISLVVHPENTASVTMFRRLGAKFRFEFGLLVGRLPVHRPAHAETVAA